MIEKDLKFMLFAMAWFCSAINNTNLVRNLQNQGIIRLEPVINAMIKVDRGNYVVDPLPYDDRPHYIGMGQTISAPHMHGYALQNLAPAIMRKDAVILDVGVGSGYLAAAMARMNPTATVYGVDIYTPLVKMAEANMRKQDADLLDSGRVTLAVRNGWDEKLPGAPYDAIHVGASADTISKGLLSQLKMSGRMIIPVGPDLYGTGQELVQVDRVAETGGMDDFRMKELMPVRFVPLVRPMNE